MNGVKKWQKTLDVRVYGIDMHFVYDEMNKKFMFLNVIHPTEYIYFSKKTCFNYIGILTFGTKTHLELE